MMNGIPGSPYIPLSNPADGSLTITDNNLSEYQRLLRNRNFRRIRVVIRSNPRHVFELEKFLATCSSKNIRVDDISLEELFRHPEDIEGSVILRPLRETLLRCNVRFYTGQLHRSFSIPDTTEILYLSVPDNGAFQPLKDYIIRSRHRLVFLCINLIVSSVDTEELVPLNMLMGWPPSLFLPDINERIIRKAIDSVKVLQPTDRRMFGSFFFPRCKVKSSKIIQELIDSGIRISGGIFLPSTCLPQTTEEQDSLEFLAKNTLDAKCGIVWGKYDEDHKGTVHDMDSWW